MVSVVAPEDPIRPGARARVQELDLFSIQEDAGGGLVFWHPKVAAPPLPAVRAGRL